jgi:hypothetical protein
MRVTAVSVKTGYTSYLREIPNAKKIISLLKI